MASKSGKCKRNGEYRSAVVKNDLKAIKKLLKRYTVVSANDSKVLEYACDHNRIEIVKLLVDNHVTVTPKAFCIAIEADNLDILKVIDTKHGHVHIALDGEHVSKFHYAAYVGAVACLNFLQLGENIDRATPDRGFCAIHLAVNSGNVEAVKALVLKGAGIDIKDRTFEQTPLHYAVLNRDCPMVEYLVQYADLSLANKHGHTAVDLAQIKPGSIIAKILERSVTKSGIENNLHKISVNVNEMALIQKDHGSRITNLEAAVFSGGHYVFLQPQSRRVKYDRQYSRAPEEPIYDKIPFDDLDNNLLGSEEKKLIRSAYGRLCENMKTTEVTRSMYSNELLTEAEKSAIDAATLPSAKNDLILKRIQTGTNAEFNKFLSILEETQQQGLVRLLKTTDKNKTTTRL